MAEKEGPLQVAFLIEASTANPAALDFVLGKAKSKGEVSIRRIYGDWTDPALSEWLPQLNKHSFTPIQQFRNIRGKNPTDATLVIDAMDILYKYEDLSVLCLFASDHDFTRLVSRFRESGIEVIGFGTTSTPDAFKFSCSEFINIDDVIKNEGANQQPKNSKTQERFVQQKKRFAHSRKYPKRLQVKSSN